MTIDYYGPNTVVNYLYNLPIQDPSDEAEMGFYLSAHFSGTGTPTHENLTQSVLKGMEFTFNNSAVEYLEDDGYKEVKDIQIKSLLDKQASITLKKMKDTEKRKYLKAIFTLAL
jgi:hypothetical protein